MPPSGPPPLSAPSAEPSSTPAATLANWRMRPHSEWAFWRVREVVPTAEIATGERIWPLSGEIRQLADRLVPDAAGGRWRLAEMLARHEADSMVVLQRGELVWDWVRPGYSGRRPHILFSISKSLTGLAAGVLAGEGRLDPNRPVSEFVPEIGDSAYAGATVRHLLDMQIATGFEEDYLNTDGDYARYRIATNWNPVRDPETQPDLHAFLATMRPGEGPHGHVMRYRSPNSDLLGWVVERAAGARLADVLSSRIWAPMGAEGAADITLDRLGASRSAGGISARPRDLARLGELVRLGGRTPDGRQVVPEAWIRDMWEDGDRAAWLAGDMVDLFPRGRYRSQWYQSGLPSGAMAAVGIHGQWLWIDPTHEVVIALVCSAHLPLDDAADQRIIAALDGLAMSLGGAA